MPAGLSPFSVLGKGGACLAGLLSFCFVLLSRAEAVPTQPLPVQVQPSLKTLLKTGTLDQLPPACQTAVAQGNANSLALLQQTDQATP